MKNDQYKKVKSGLKVPQTGQIFQDSHAICT